jgi:hypothetical protein
LTREPIRVIIFLMTKQSDALLNEFMTLGWLMGIEDEDDSVPYREYNEELDIEFECMSDHGPITYYTDQYVWTDNSAQMITPKQALTLTMEKVRGLVRFDQRVGS